MPFKHGHGVDAEYKPTPAGREFLLGMLIHAAYKPESFSSMKNLVGILIWSAVAALGAWGYIALAGHRGETLNSAYMLIAALCSYAIGYRFYSKWIAARVLVLDPRRAPPCEVHDDGRDYVKTNKWIVFGHHFAAISGPGPLVGPVLAAQFGYLPSALWILIGVVLGGAVQDFVILFLSMRRDGKSLGQMVKDELNTLTGWLAMAAILAIMIILLAVLGLVVVRALAESPWGVFTVGATIPIAMLMGTYLRYGRVGKVMEASALGVVLLLLAVWGGKWIHEHGELGKAFTLGAEPLAWAVILYGLAASVLPVWLLLAPRDYLSTFMKLGTIFALALGIFLVLPELKMPAITPFADNGEGLVVAGKLFPFCFITIACGAISGFHTLISSGTTPKIITREHYARPIGYGAMLLESLVAIMALIAACTLEPGVYFSINTKGPAATVIQKVTAAGYPVTEARMTELAGSIGEKSLFGRTGGASTLAVGMAGIFSKVTHGRWLDLWYHFAIMFEALFILTTLDAGTRVGRYLLQDFLGHLWKPLGLAQNNWSGWVASLCVVGGWGYFLIQGVRDPLGGINSLWPLFGIANQLLASIALCLGVTVILKSQLRPVEAPLTTAPQTGIRGKPALALVMLLPLIWLLSVTVTAGLQKILHPDPKIGFLAQAAALDKALPALAQKLSDAQSGADAKTIAAARQAVKDNRSLKFNQQLDAVVAGAFLALVGLVFLLCVREWLLLLARKRVSELHETPPSWLPHYVLLEEKPLRLVGLFTLGMALLRELSGETELARNEAAHAREHTCANQDHEHADSPVLNAAASTPGKRYAQSLERKFNQVRRCC